MCKVEAQTDAALLTVVQLAADRSKEMLIEGNTATLSADTFKMHIAYSKNCEQTQQELLHLNSGKASW